MRSGRRAYYDRFSTVYDRFVSLHSRDKQGLARKFLAEMTPVSRGGSVLDLCSGTATLLQHLRDKVIPEGRAVGVDFSHGMLTVAKEKIKDSAGTYLVEADAACLPFQDGSFDAVTCSHAFYELKGETQHLALQEIVRVLKPEGSFLLMEHDVPTNRFVKALFYLRIAFIGSGRAIRFLQRERAVLQEHFGTVEKVLAPAGRSKIMICRKAAGEPRPAHDVSATCE